MNYEKPWKLVLVAQPASNPHGRSLKSWAAEVFIEGFSREGGLVGDDTINVQIKLTLQILDGVDGPGINLLAALVSLCNETMVEAVLFDAEEIDIQPRGFAGIE